MEKQPNNTIDKLTEELDILTAKKKLERIIDTSVDAKDTINKLEEVFDEFPRANIRDVVFKKIFYEEYEDVNKKILEGAPNGLEYHLDALAGVKEYFFGKTETKKDDTKK